MSEDRKHTALGTPCAGSWDEAWIARVEAVEEELGRRVCGARTMSGTPCTLTSDHPSGRCRFHGGFALTGAPKGNRNAVLHGLYSRRLQVCGKHCPLWRTCPLWGDDVAELAQPKDGRRPVVYTCPYEQAEYDEVVADGMARYGQASAPDAMDRYLVHTLALLQVMMSRGARALTQQKLIDLTSAFSSTYTCERYRVHPYLEAFLRIAGEYRRFRRMLDANLPFCPPGDRDAPPPEPKEPAPDLCESVECRERPLPSKADLAPSAPVSSGTKGCSGMIHADGVTFLSRKAGTEELLKKSHSPQRLSERPGLSQAESAAGGRRRDCPRSFPRFAVDDSRTTASLEAGRRDGLSNGVTQRCRSPAVG